MTTDNLDREIERQRKALADLPTNFTFPLFNSKHALESQRRSNYRSTAAAAREIADNAKEAGATRMTSSSIGRSDLGHINVRTASLQ